MRQHRYAYGPMWLYIYDQQQLENETMHYLLCSIKDRAIDAFQPVGNCRAEGEAIRVFKDMIADPNSAHGKHPDDYDLYIVGHFDDRTGELTPKSPPQKIADGKTIKETINT